MSYLRTTDVNGHANLGYAPRLVLRSTHIFFNTLIRRTIATLHTFQVYEDLWHYGDRSAYVFRSESWCH